MPKAQSRQVQPAWSLRGHLRHPGRDSQLRIASAIADYLADLRARRSAQAADRLKQLLTDFRRSCHRSHLRAINRRDLIAYMAALRGRGLADRTIFNRMSTVLTFLRSFGVEGFLSRRDLPRYTQKSVDAYGEAEISQLLRAGNEKPAACLHDGSFQRRKADISSFLAYLVSSHSSLCDALQCNVLTALAQGSGHSD